MKISNFREYIGLLAGLYNQHNWQNAFFYMRDNLPADRAKASECAALQKEVRLVKAKILQLREELKTANDKKALSWQITVEKEKRAKLLLQAAKVAKTAKFLQLNNETKACICSSYLMQKFLLNELDRQQVFVQNRQLNGMAELNIEAFKNSDFYQQAVHVCDYVTAYILQNPTKVDSPGFFKTLLPSGAGWPEVVGQAEAYFEEQRQKEARDPAKQDNIKASREGVQVIKTYPESGLQAVRLLTKEALDYEGKQMGHCIGSGSYDKSLEDGSRQYYSIRELSADGEWKPHVTFECEKDIIRQCKGKNNTAVIGRYLKEARDFAAQLIGHDKLSMVNSDKVKDWKNLGYTSDNAGNIWDLQGREEIIDAVFSSLSVDCDDLAKWPPLKNVKAESLGLNGVADRKVWDKVCEFSDIDVLNLSGVKIAGETEIDLLRNRKTASYQDLILPGTLLKHVRSFEGCWINNLRIVGKVDEAGLAKLFKTLDVRTIEFERVEFEKIRKVDFSDWMLLPKEERHNCEFAESGIGKITLDIAAELKKCGCVVMEEMPAFSFKFAEGKEIDVDEWSFPQNVTALDFVNLTGAAVKTLKPDCYPRLKHLVMEFYPSNGFYVNQTDNGLDWEELPVPQNIEELKIATFRPKYGKYADFSVFPRLRRLDLHSVDFSHVEKVNFNNPNLEQLDLSNSRLGGTTELDLSALKKLKVFNIAFLVMGGIEKVRLPDNLESISIMHNKDFYRVMDFHNCQRMKNLSLSLSVDIGNRKLEDILPPNLEELFCNQLLLNNAETLDLSRYDKLKSIQIHTLKADNLKKISLPHSCEKLVVTMAEIPELQKWNLAECGKLNDVTLMAGTIGKVAELRPPSSLRRLNLGGLTMPDLKILDLSHCRMAEHLSLHAFKTPQLEQVYMPACIKEVTLFGYKFPEQAKVMAAADLDADFGRRLEAAMVDGKHVQRQEAAGYAAWRNRRDALEF